MRTRDRIVARFSFPDMACIAIFARKIFYPTAAATRATHNVGARSNTTPMREKPQNSCGFAQYDAISMQNVDRTHRHTTLIACAMQKFRSRDRTEHQHDESRDIDRAKNFRVHRSCPRSCNDRSCGGDRRSRSHRRIDVCSLVHRSRVRRPARRNRIGGSSGPENRSAGPKIPCPTPESATRGETGRFTSFPPPDHDPMHPSSSFLRRGDTPMQHPHLRERRRSRPTIGTHTIDRSPGATMSDAQMKRAGGHPPALRSSIDEKD